MFIQKVLKCYTRVSVLLSAITLCLFLAPGAARADHDEYLAGYLILPVEQNADKSYNAGFSMYVPVWPLLSNYPGHQFQTGLPGTWMGAQYEGPEPKNNYTDIEGGLGWWRDTRFPTVTPKFIMGGVATEFSEIANGPAHGKGTWAKPEGLYGVAQLSPWLLFPIDGLNLKQGTSGDLLGYGYLKLPLTDRKATTNGADVPTGNQCWTLFLNSRNFKGPVAFFLPEFWSKPSVTQPRLVRRLLDQRPSNPNSAVQMETQYVPCRIATDSRGQKYARIAPTSFPTGPDGKTTLMQRNTVYNNSALWNPVEAWFAGGSAPSGTIDMNSAHLRQFTGDGDSTWEIRVPGADGKETKVSLAWKSFAHSINIGSTSHGYQWNDRLVTRSTANGGPLVTLPEYFHLENENDADKAKWVPISREKVPDGLGLKRLTWDTPTESPQEAYTTPGGPNSFWKKPGPVAGPFKAHLGDGSVVTYFWYRFADQPAIMAAKWSDAERELIQKRVEMIHRSWPKGRHYLPAPGSGTLADIDTALIVKPPVGYEIGYVPIATRQQLER